MARRSSGKRKKGKCVRAARLGQTGKAALAHHSDQATTERRLRRKEKRQEDRERRRSDAVDAPLASKAESAADTGESAYYSKEELKGAPHSFVFHRGKVGKGVLHLQRDIRMVMRPFTASKLKILRRNNLKDFVTNATPLGVTHLVILTRSKADCANVEQEQDLAEGDMDSGGVQSEQTDDVKADMKPETSLREDVALGESVQLRIVRLPHGPTVTFKVRNYALARDVLASLKRPYFVDKHFLIQPLVVMSGFDAPTPKGGAGGGDDAAPALGGRHLALVREMFQNMFPPISVDSLQVSRVRRCVMLNYDAGGNSFDFRHYAIKLVPSGVSRPVKKLVQKRVPNLAKYEDISDFILNPDNLSESEAEMDSKEIEVAADMTERAAKKGSKVNVRLVELGPRLTLSLFKIEAGLSDGEVLYHADGAKSKSEVAGLRKKHAQSRKQKESRRRQQERDVRRKAAEREAHRRKCALGQDAANAKGAKSPRADAARVASKVDARKRKLAKSFKSVKRKAQKK